MKKLSLLLLFLPFLLASCADDWKVYGTSEFSIEFPGPVKDTTTMVGNLAGSKVYYEPVSGSLDSNLYYSVSLYTLPDSVSVLGDDMDDIIQTDVKIYAWSIGGILADSGRVVKSGTYSGKEFKVFLPQQTGTATIRKFAKGKHLYTLLVVTDQMRLNNQAIERFLNSFKLK